MELISYITGYITGLKPNHTTARPVTLAGDVDTDGSCKGSTYSDPYDTWTDVVVLASIKITLQEYIADVRINSSATTVECYSDPEWFVNSQPLIAQI
ncbi:hypothetical protein P5V15_015862 [Pogonomyrmex californicus]